ncbi:MAG: hypothetical protein F9K40_12595 [Kofleriaceae bacterium]|nr:MAG: hypothetical protein F9K40_12595 [Kofleriaceae bacterium]MBZ0237819.1 hypothetical protein [Kofleriaceae bacterium]
MKRNLSLPIFAVWLVVAVAVLGLAARPARAEVGVGLFVGQPTGIDLKLDLQRKTALDIVAGWKDFDDDGRDGYAHLTFLVNLGNARGRSVVVPFRLGIGGAVWDRGGDFGDDVNIAVRAPFQVGIRFRRTPLEIYGEVALVLVFIDENDNEDNVDADGGIGLRVYF